MWLATFVCLTASAACWFLRKQISLANLLNTYFGFAYRLRFQEYRLSEILFPINTRSTFQYPQIKPILNLDLTSTTPTCYRPFKWGPNYFVTMGIRPMDWNNWIELDGQFTEYHTIRSNRVRNRPGDTIITLPASSNVPSGASAVQELMYELSEYLSRRYPNVFRVTRHKPRYNDFGWYGEGQISTIEILPLLQVFNLDQDNPMVVCGLLVQDDLTIMIKGKDELYYCQAGIVCMAGSWRLRDKIGLPLSDIHFHGQVPQYKEKLQTSLDRFFAKIPTTKPVTRNNYFLQVVKQQQSKTESTAFDPDEIAWNTTINGDEDEWNHAPKKTAEPALTVDEIRFRTERQSLRRLPKSGAIVFTIRTYMVPIVNLAQEPEVPARLASAIRSMPPDILRYKGARFWKDCLLEYLDRQAELQSEASQVDLPIVAHVFGTE